jgi:hypothetical protein
MAPDSVSIIGMIVFEAAARGTICCACPPVAAPTISHRLEGGERSGTILPWSR